MIFVVQYEPALAAELAGNFQKEVVRRFVGNRVSELRFDAAPGGVAVSRGDAVTAATAGGAVPVALGPLALFDDGRDE